VHHAGGVAGSEMGVSRTVPTSLFDGAPRYHGGSSTLGYGLAADEEAAILLRGEKVLNRQQTQAFNAGLSMSGVLGQIGSGGGTGWQQAQGQEIVINFYDKDGNKQQQTANNNGMGNMSIDVLLNEVDKGLAQRIIQGKSQSARAYDTTRGISAARQKYN
jgi:hypothetical protein